MNRYLSRWTVTGLGLVMLTLTGCSKDSQSTEKSGTAAGDVAGAVETAAAEAAADPAVVAKLTAADALDGTVDGVVSRCAGCSLGMDGSDKHALTVGAHKMHFCSDHCRSTFAKDVTKGILALSVPSGE